MVANIRDRVKAVMDKKGITVADLARETKIPSARIYKWFKDGLNPKGTDSLILEQWLNKIEEVPHETLEEPQQETNSLYEASLINAKTIDRLVNALLEVTNNKEQKELTEIAKGIKSIKNDIDMVAGLHEGYQKYWADHYPPKGVPPAEVMRMIHKNAIAAYRRIQKEGIGLSGGS